MVGARRHQQAQVEYSVLLRAHQFLSIEQEHCLLGIAVNRVRTEDLLQSSLMLATALVPHLGYDRATQLAAHAHENQLSLRDAAIALGFPTAAQFDLWVDPRQMLGPRASR